MPNLVGIGNSQVPTNAMLGGLAYQDPDHASITNVDILDIAAIKAKVNETALGVFVYNTANDTDGGAWRKRCNGTSWYNEPPGVYRGPRKEFPTVAIIVTTNQDLIIYDGDDPNCPMWMTFPQKGYLTWPLTSNYTTHQSYALNGAITQISNDGGSIIKFIDDYFDVIYGSKSHSLTMGRSIANRAETSSFLTLTNSANRRTYNTGEYNMRHVHMHVTKDAPIDPRNGLPYPTILIGDAKGNHIIKGDGSVPTIIQVSDNVSATRPCDWGVIRSDDTLTFWNINNGTVQNIWNWNDLAADYDVEWKYNYWVGGGHGSVENITAIGRRDNNDVDGASIRGIEKNYNDPSYVYVATSSGLSMIKDGDSRTFTPSTQTIFDSKVAYITKRYATGWLFGDIRCCVLASCEDTDLVPEATTNHVVDPGFSDASKWSASADGRWTISGGQAVHDGTGGGYFNGTFSPALTAGKWYVMIVDLISGTIGNGGSGFGLVNHNNSNYYKPQSNTEYVDTYCTYVPMHTNQGGHRGIMIWRENSSGNAAVCNLYSSGAAVTVDNVVVKEIKEPYYGRELSNSHTTGYPIVPIGTPTREPVNEGCDLQCWTGFTNTDFFVQPARDFLNYDNGNFWYSIWVNPNSSDSGDVIFSRDGVAGGNNGRFMCYFHNDCLRVDMCEYGSSASPPYQGMESTQQGIRQRKEWIHIVFVRSGGELKFFINGELDSTHTLNSTSDGTQSGGQSSGIGVLYIGANSNSGNPLDKGKVALFKTGRGNNTLPSAEEIKEWYGDELPMFSPNAKCSLYGSHNDVVALSHDQNTDILHVGTASGRSEFNGLVRINNTTDGITSANGLSASGGVVAEQ